MAADRICYRHPEFPAMATCIECGRPICADCVIRVDTYVFCGMQCAETRQRRMNHIAPARAGWGISPRGCLMVIVTAMALAAVVYAVFGFHFGFEEVNERITGLVAWIQGVFGGRN